MKPITILSTILFSVTSHAFVNYKSTTYGNADIFEGPASVALGGSGLAAKSANESGHLNPATLPLLDGAHFGFIYGSESAGENAGSNKYHVVVSEATDEVAFPGALTFSKVGVSRNGKETSLQEVHMGLGADVTYFLSLGLGVKYLVLEAPNEAQKSGFNTTLGVLASPHRSVGLALVFDDIMENKDISTNSTIGLGGQYVFDRVVRLRLDGVLPQKDNPSRLFIIKSGIESLFLGYGVNMRVGYRWDEFRSQRYFTSGIGWQGPRLGLNYAYEKNALSEDYRHLIDMLLQF